MNARVGAIKFWICNNMYREITTATNVDLTTSAGTIDMWYLYDDGDTAGSTPSLSFSTTEPVFTEDVSNVSFHGAL